MFTKNKKELKIIATSLILAILPLQAQGMQESQKDGYPLGSFNTSSIYIADKMRDWVNCDYQEIEFKNLDAEIGSYFDNLNDQIILMKKECVQRLTQSKTIVNHKIKNQGVDRAITCFEDLMSLEKELILTEELYLNLKTLKDSEYFEIEPCFSEYFTK